MSARSYSGLAGQHGGARRRVLRVGEPRRRSGALLHHRAEAERGQPGDALRDQRDPPLAGVVLPDDPHRQLAHLPLALRALGLAHRRLLRTARDRRRSHVDSTAPRRRRRDAPATLSSAGNDSA